MSNIRLKRRGLFMTAVLGLLSAAAAIAQAPAYPSHPIRLIVPSTPGGGPDIVGRLVAQSLAPRLGQIIIENVAGAAGQVGTLAVVRAAPDGYTLLFAPPSPISIAENFEPKPPYDAFRDLVPMGLIGRNPALIVINSSIKAATLREFIALAKADPRKFFYGSPGQGNAFHLITELVSGQAGIQMTHVPYKGSGPAVIGLLAGDIQFLVQSAEAVKEHVKNGRLRALATLESTRLAAFPDLPTLSEGGLANLGIMNWYGVFAPANTPRSVIDLWERELLALARDATFADKMRAMSFDPVAFDSKTFVQMLAAERTQWRSVIKSAGIDTRKQ